MALSHSPSIVTNGLVLCLDAANRKGYDKFENLMTSSQLGNTVLNDGGMTLTTDTSIINPFGGSDGVLKCVHTTQTPGYFRRGQNMSLTAGVTYTFSFYFKNGTVSNPYGQNPINLGILASTYSPTFEEPSQSLNTNINVGNGWYRQVFTFTPTYTQTYQVDFNQSVNQTPIGTYYLYGFQLEIGSTVTDYYATTSTAKNRGTIWSDLSGRGNTGTLTNGVKYSNSNIGSLVLDGVDDYIPIGTTGFPFGSSAGTLCAWCKTNTITGGYSWSISYGTPGSGQSRFLGINASTYYFGGFGDDITASGVPSNTWFNMVGVYDGTNASMYINGVLVSGPTAKSWNTIASNAQLGRQTFNGEYWNGNISQVSVYNRALSAAEIQQNYSALKGRFIPDGSSADSAAPSASYLVSLGLTTDGVYWINLPTVGPTQIYCILNPAYDGGGWMMMMKATTGTTFNYSANYWTTANTLNPTQTNRNNGDAKFNSMNYFQAKDMMAIWPDISNGGSIPSSTLGWTWLENNFNDGTRITPISFFGITYPTMNTGGSGKFIKDAKTFSGWASGVFSSQVDIRFYGFNYINNPSYGLSMKCRWGFGWNENAEGLYPSSGGGAPGSNDVTGGIGLDTGGGSYSAGDRINCCQDTTGINRSARVEIYVR